MDNIIKIYLRQTGGIAELYKTIPLYVGMYNTAILDVYVPATLISENVSVKAGAILTANDGTKATTDSLPMTYKETTTYRQVEYDVYELNPFPANFLNYAGNQDIVINIVQLEDEEVERVITTQIANIDVLDSSLIPDEELNASAVDLMNARITTNEQNISTNASNIETNTTNIATNTSDIASNTQRIARIEQTMSTGENYVGGLIVQTLDGINAELNDLVEVIEGRSPLNGDVVIVTLEIQGGTDQAYKYFYTNSGWQDYPIPAIESASNTDKGLIQGTYGQALQTQVDISGGQINNIYVVDGQNNLRNIREYLNTTATNINNIISGTTKVGYAVKADEDANGNNIVSTYMTQNAGATKQDLKNYALPREFNDLYYLGQNVWGNTKPSTSIEYEQTIQGIGTYTLLSAELQSTASFELSYKNSYQAVFYISASEDVSCQFRLDTTYGDENILMNTELSNQMVMTANNVYKVQFNDNFNNLSGAISFNDGSPVIKQTLSIVSTDSTQNTFTVYSNLSNLSTFNLNTNSYLVRVEQGYLGEIPSISSVGEIDGEIVTFPVNRNLLDNTLVRFDLSFEGEATYIKLVDEQTEEEFYLITPYNTGVVGENEVDRPTVSDLAQTQIKTSGGVTTITFVGLVDTVEGYGTKIFVNEDNLSEIKSDISTLQNNMPTKTSDLTNDGDGTSQFITEDFLDDSYITIARIRVLFSEEFNQGGNN